MVTKKKIEKRLSHYHTIIPLEERGVLMRLDTLPFIVTYLILILIDADKLQISPFDSVKKWCHVFVFPFVLFMHLTLFLAVQWSVSIKARVGYRRGKIEVEKDQCKWTHCLVIPPTPNSMKKTGRTEIVPVSYHEFQGGGRTTCNVAIIQYEETIFRSCLSSKIGHDPEMDSIWSPTATSSYTVVEFPEITDGAKTTFHRLHYPNDMPISFYTKQWKGHNLDTFRAAKRVYSNNSIKIILPPFIDLLKQQLLAPFFLFQILCVMLWCLDEYWYYAIFTLFTLILFESTVAYTRLKNLQRLRNTLRIPYGVWVYRGKWEFLSTEELVAGDILSITSSSSTPHHKDHEGGTHIPADLLLLNGGAIVNEATLTGESVPQIKSSIQDVASTLSISNENDDRCFDIDDGIFKSAILFSGTILVNHSTTSSDDDEGECNNDSLSIPSPPDDGCIAFVLRTGFDTQQGSLLRSMIHTSTKQSQSDSTNSFDTFIFILILLFCAVVSAGYVLHHGWSDPTRNRFKLVLHVIIIITSVVPPELPMELSLAVTSSISDLVQRCSVYCTEPFRIPLAGMVNTCCFDKTGTLTSDEMILRGVRLPRLNDDIIIIDENMSFPSIQDENEGELTIGIPMDTLRVMIGCQSLTIAPLRGINPSRSTDNLIGDPLEKAVMEASRWRILQNSFVAPPESLSTNFPLKGIKILHIFSFTSKLKRMTVIAKDMSSMDIWALSKGAPETLKNFMDTKSIPVNYDEVSQFHMAKGQRVLALAFKKLRNDNINFLKKSGRGDLEQNLIFAGFIVLDCPLKPDTRKVIKDLRRSGNYTVMITGDAVLTASEVAKQCGIISTKGIGKVYELRDLNPDGDYRLAFVAMNSHYTATVDSESCIAYSYPNIKVVKEMLNCGSIQAICITGDTLDKIATLAVQKNIQEISSSYLDPKTVLFHPDAQRALQEIVPYISVFARHAPRQKEAVVAALNGAGRVTIMCGDGCNDLGAIKMAHCGISIISVPDLEAKQRNALEGLQKMKKEEDYNSRNTNKTKSQKKTWEQHARALLEAEEEINGVSLGDASVASPFTSRVTSIKCTTDIMQRGRCTLVTMNQIYKILGVNCLVNALVLSTLHLAGVKQGDTQLTIVGIVVAGLFFFVTKGQPLNKLSRHRPPSSVLSGQIMLSILMQFLIHFACIMSITFLSQSYLDPFDPSLVPDGAFNPNILNSATFIMTVLCTVNTFVVNYRGRPYMQDLSENHMMVRGLQISYLTVFCCALEVFPPLNNILQLVPFPTRGSMMLQESALMDKGAFTQYFHTLMEAAGFKATLCFFMIIDSTCSYFTEKTLIKVFEPHTFK